MAVTMQQVAELAGVSRATVSDVLRDRWREKGISRDTRCKIERVARETNYRPNRLAQSLVYRKTHMIGVQIPSFTGYWSKVMKGLDSAVRKHGYNLLFSAPAEWRDEGDEVRRLAENRVDGLLVGFRLGRRQWRLYRELTANKTPFVGVGNRDRMCAHAVVDDGFSQASLAVEHLVSLGHRRIAYIYGGAHHQGQIDRRRGFRATMAKHGLSVNKDYMAKARFDPALAGRALRRMLTLPEPPTAVYCGSDLMALGVIRELDERGLSVPGDISVMGHGDELEHHWFNRIPLTTIRQPAELLAELSVGMLVDLIEDRRPETPVIVLPGELVVRGSTGAPTT